MILEVNKINFINELLNKMLNNQLNNQLLRKMLNYLGVISHFR